LEGLGAKRASLVSGPFLAAFFAEGALKCADAAPLKREGSRAACYAPLSRCPFFFVKRLGFNGFQDRHGHRATLLGKSSIRKHPGGV